MPYNRHNYPPDWEQISHRIKCRARWKCEGSPAYPGCRARQYQPHPRTGAKVVLTVAHLDHDTGHNADSNLRAWCQRCHLTYDAKYHAQNAAQTRRAKKLAAGQIELIL